MAGMSDAWGKGAPHRIDLKRRFDFMVRLHASLAEQGCYEAANAAAETADRSFDELQAIYASVLRKIEEEAKRL